MENSATQGTSQVIRLKMEDGTYRTVGKVVGDAFIGHRKEEHIFRGGQKSLASAINEGTASWGMGAKNCVDMYENGVRRVKLITDEAIYECPLELYLNEDIRFKRHRWPFGTQYFVNLVNFNITQRR